jgi:hypothetical protein
LIGFVVKKHVKCEKSGVNDFPRSVVITKKFKLPITVMGWGKCQQLLSDTVSIRCQVNIPIEKLPR